MNAEASFLFRWTSQSPAKGRDGLLPFFCLKGDGHRQRCNKDSRESQNIIEHAGILSMEKENKGDVELQCSSLNQDPRETTGRKMSQLASVPMEAFLLAESL